MIGGVTLVYLIQHGEKEPLPGDPGLTGTGRDQAIRTGRRLRDAGIRALYSSPMRRARETARGYRIDHQADGPVRCPIA